MLEPVGYASIIVNTDSDQQRESRLVNVLRDRGVDGIIHAAALRNDPSIAKAAEDGLPVVTLNRRVEPSSIPSVVNDEAAGIYEMMRHLRDLGHRHIAHLAGPQDLSTGQVRLIAFHQAAAALSIALDPQLIATSTRFEENEGARCVRILLESKQRFTAVLCANDRLALGAIEELRQNGLGCPKDISVTGFNDMPFLDLIRPRLTTVRIQQFDSGRTTAAILLRLMNPEAGDDVPMRTILPISLVIRESTARCDPDRQLRQ